MQTDQNSTLNVVENIPTDELLNMLTSMTHDAKTRAVLGRNMEMLRETYRVLRAELLRRLMPRERQSLSEDMRSAKHQLVNIQTATGCK